MSPDPPSARFSARFCAPSFLPLPRHYVYRSKKLLLKGNQTFTLHGSRACSDNIIRTRSRAPVRTDHGTKKENFLQMWDVLHKGSSFLSFISLLMIVALFLRMESINRKTEMNELRIASDDRSIAGFHMTSLNFKLQKY